VTKLSKKEKAVAKAIGERIRREGNSLDKRRIIETLADAFAKCNSQFDRDQFLDTSYHHCPITPMISVAEVTKVLSFVRKLHPEAQMDDAVAALALLSADAGCDKDAFIAFASK
jgi:hypothetical protein